MSTQQGRSVVNTRTLGVGSVVGVAIGTALIIVGDAVLGTVGVILVLAGVISLLLSVGSYLGDDGTDAEE